MDISQYRGTLENIAVEADSIEDYLNRYYRPDRYRMRGDEYAAGLLRSYQKTFKKFGYVITSKHDNITGHIIAWLGPKNNTCLV